MYHLYVLKSLSADKRHYVGISKDPEGRLQEHNRGRVRSTKGYRPWEVIHREMFPDRAAATQREVYLKTLSGHAWLKELLIQKGVW